jgi:hypothetical protein
MGSIYCRRTLQNRNKEHRKEAIKAKDIRRLQKVGRRREIYNKESGMKREERNKCRKRVKERQKQVNRGTRK